MSFEGLIAWLIIGAVAGWLASVIVRGFGFGLVGNIIVGIIGAAIAGFLFPTLGVLAFHGKFGSAWVVPIIHATIGAVILLLVVGITRKRIA